MNGEYWNLQSRGLIVPGTSKSNQFAEIYAIYTCIKDTIDINDTEIVIRSDSKYAIDCITKLVKIWTINDNKTKSGKVAKHIEIIKEISEMIEGRKITLTKVKSHIGN